MVIFHRRMFVWCKKNKKNTVFRREHNTRFKKKLIIIIISSSYNTRERKLRVYLSKPLQFEQNKYYDNITQTFINYILYSRIIRLRFEKSQ